MKTSLSQYIHLLARIMLGLVVVLSTIRFTPAKGVHAYSAINERPSFLAWPLPTYIGLARISQFPNTPWTWNYLGLNSGQQCPPAFGYVLDAGFWPVWRDTSIPEKQDIARADPHNFEMVNCYSTLGEAGKNGHEGTDIKAPAQTPAYASADGKVAGWRLDDVNSMIVLKHCLGGAWDAVGTCVEGTKWYTTYMHIIPDRELFVMEKDVLAGTQVGVIYNQGDNSHLHFEVGLEKRSYTNYVNPWGRDEAPWYGCMWQDQSLCVQPNPGYERIAILTKLNRLFIRDDALHIVEVFEAGQVQQFQMVNQRMAIIDQNKNLLVKDAEFKRGQPFGYPFLRNWVNLGNDIGSFQITGNRVAVLQVDGALKIKQGDLQSDWMLQANHVSSFSISEHRIGILTTDGSLLIREGDLTSDWKTLAINVRDFQLLDTRVAVLDLLGNLYVQEGPLTAEWKALGTNVQVFQLAGTRVAFVDKDGTLLVNDGNLRAEFLLQAADVQQFQVADDRIVILGQDGIWKIKEGDLYQSWKDWTGPSVQEIWLSDAVPTVVE